MQKIPYPAAARAGEVFASPSDGNAAQAPAPHKWRDLMDPLKRCVRKLVLNGTDVHFLEVLLSFVPGDVLRPDAEGRIIVFAGNAAIAARMGLSGDSTVNRCIRRAEERGLILRVMSPNRKRFRRLGQGGATLRAYGIDLGPLAAARDTLLEMLVEQEAEEVRLDALRLDCAELLADLRRRAAQLPATQAPAVAVTLHDFARRLRRVPETTALEALLADMQDSLATLRASPDLSDISAPDEQHKDHQIQISPEDSPAPRTAHEFARAFPTLTRVIEGNQDTFGIRESLDLAASLLPGTERAWKEAKTTMGPERASILLGYVLERHGRISNPGGYLRQMNKRWRQGEVELSGLIASCMTNPATRPETGSRAMTRHRP